MRRALQEMLQNQAVSTQEEIKESLNKQGFDTNQVKVSRLLHKIGAIKMPEGDNIVYRLPTELMNINPNDSLKQMILSIVHNEAMIIIQTSPGCAQFIARLLDQKKDMRILGTVAGDDTIFIAPEKIKEIKKVYKTISEYLL